MISKLGSLTMEVLGISLAFFLVVQLLTQTGIGAKLYGLETAHGTYVINFFFGLTCAAGLVQMAAIKNDGVAAALGQVVLPILLAWLAMGVAMLLVGVLSEISKIVSGGESVLFVMAGTAALMIGAFAATLILRRHLPATIPSVMVVVGAGLLGVICMLYMARPETNKSLVFACFIFGFVAYLSVRTRGMGLLSA